MWVTGTDIRHNAPMNNFSGIDAVLMPWAAARGLHVYTGHKQNLVRSVTVYVWQGPRHESLGHIWLDPPNELGLVGLHAALGAFRLDEAVQPPQLATALDAACARLAEHKICVEA
jgi:hypothetical protein